MGRIGRLFFILATIAVCASVGWQPAYGAIAEVQGVGFPNKTTLTWSPSPGTEAYNVYRGNLATLRASGGTSYGNCYQAGLTPTQVTDATNPSPGQVNFYIVTGTIGVNEGTMGKKSSGAERPNNSPCLILPPPLRDRINPNGLQLDGVSQGVEAARNPGIANDLTGLVGGGLYLHTGEYFAQAVDMEIPGRGVSWRHVRSYRSQISHNGQQGYNWTFNYDRRVVSSGSGIVYLDGTGREDAYLPLGLMYEPTDPGIYSKILHNLDGTFTLRERDGTLYHHRPLDGSPTAGSLTAVEDRLGNRITFLYTANGLLRAAVDTQGRAIDYYWDSQGRLHRVVDFMGRELRYAYDAAGNLIAATSPAVTGTSTGNDFPIGKTTTYTYSSGMGDPRLDHNLLTVTAPGDTTAVIQNSFNPSDELMAQFYGGTNASGIPAGGIFQYQIIPVGGGFRDTRVIDRNGVQHVVRSDSAGHVTLEEIFTIGVRPSDPPSFVTQHAYNATGERINTLHPLGNQVLYTYDDVNPDRFQRGNLLSVRRVADLARGDGFGGLLTDIEVHYVYEPLYNQQRSIADPLGRSTTYAFDYQEGNPSTNGVNDLAAKWNISLGSVPLAIGDVNRDGLLDQAKGSPVRLTQPTVSLLSGGRQAAIEGGPFQPIETLYRYNGKGQLVAEIDPELNVTTHQYYAETDPDGDGVSTPTPIDGRVLDPTTGGYLAVTTLDANPTGHLTPSEIARRNNATNPVPAQIRNDYAYDPMGNLIRSVDGPGTATHYEVNQLGQIVSVRRGATSGRSTNLDPDPPLTGFVAQQIYNARNEIVSRRVQDLGDLSNTGGFVDIDFVYDILGRQVSMAQELGAGLFATTQYRWDPQGNRTATIFPEGNVFTMQPDERGLLYRLVRGDDDLTASNGGPSGSSMQVYDYDANGNPNRYVDGRGTAWALTNDGMDRRVRSENFPATSFFDITYNLDEAIAQIRIVERIGMVDRVRYDALPLYDELGRVKEIRQSIRDANGNLLFEDADGDGYVSVKTEYDRNSRRSRSWSDSSKTQDFDYDGAGRMIRKVDNLGNTAVLFYDSGNNLVQTLETELGPAGAETFTTASSYDRLGRLKTTTDALGNTKSLAYDSRDNLILMTDALGNTIAYEHNGLNRLSRIARDLRVGGKAPGAVYGQIVYQYVADHNGRVTSAIDPNGNATTYAYDALDRLIRTSFADGTTQEYTYDANDNVVQLLDANGSTVTNVYDLADRPTQRNVAPAPGVHGNSQTYAYDAMNRLVRAVDQNDAGPTERTEIQFTWDCLNRIRTERSQFGSHAPVLLNFAYNGEGNRTSASYFGNTLTYGYDALNRLVHAQDVMAGFNVSYSYLGPDRVAERRHGNGTRKSYLDASGTSDIGYDGIRRVEAIRHYNATSTVLAGFDYTHDAMGNITSEKRLHHLGKGDVWTYDSAYRVVGFKQDVDNPLAELAVPGSGGFIRHRVDYTLDGVGNWVQRLVDGLPRGNTPNNLNEYDDPQAGGTRVDDGIPDDFNDDLNTPAPDGTNLAHDKNGDLTKEGTRTYEYDAFHRLVWVRDGGSPVAHYVYDGLNRRIAKQDFVGGTDSRFLWDGDRIVVERNLAETTTKKRFFPGVDIEIVAMQLVGTGTLYYVHDDTRGSTVMVTDPTANVVERVTYDDNGAPEFRDAFNNLTGATQSIVGNPFLYQGQYYDSETKFYERRGAVFAPRFGRHIQRFVPGQHVGPLGSALNVPWFFPCPFNWIGLNPFWWAKGWFWHPGAWFAGWWAWKPFWWWGGAWGWWAWQPWLWFGAPGFGWWIMRPWVFWWHAPFNWWGWPAWWIWPGWWGWWPFWGWFGWTRWLPVWGWLGWKGWWPFWGWWGWWGWWPACGWWGWWGWWPWWNIWWGWHPWWWWGWWTWMPFIWHGFWGWSGLSFWWNWWLWIRWWPWGWWHWIGWFGWWGWFGWNPWWWWGWGGWWFHGWIRGWFWWWGPMGWWPWFCWGWWPWWWWGWWGWWGWIWGCWIWCLVWWGFWSWGWWWWWTWGWWGWPWWGWFLWWGWWWPWWGWWS